jgi:hypothetical protein
LNSTFNLGGDLTVNRLGFGAMRLTGEGIWGWPPDRENAIDKIAPERAQTGKENTTLHFNSPCGALWETH